MSLPPVRLRLEPAVKKALRACAAQLDDLGADWAIAGATAMHAHGYSRATRDVDLFIGDDVRPELLSRLRASGIPVTTVFSPMHYRIDPRGRIDPEASIDLLFPALGVESLGLMAARRAQVEGVEMPIVPLEHLIALKLTTDPELDPSRYVRDQADLIALRDRGLLDVGRVAQILEDVADPDARARLRQLVQDRSERVKPTRTARPKLPRRS